MGEERVESGAEVGDAAGPGGVAASVAPATELPPVDLPEPPAAAVGPPGLVEPKPLSALAQEVARLRLEVARLDRELVELRMERRKVMLEELAGLEKPLVERGALARRTREPRH